MMLFLENRPKQGFFTPAANKTLIELYQLPVYWCFAPSAPSCLPKMSIE